MVRYAVFGEIPSLQMLVGVAIVVSARFIIIWREAQLGIEGAKTRAMNHLLILRHPLIERTHQMASIGTKRKTLRNSAHGLRVRALRCHARAKSANKAAA